MEIKQLPLQLVIAGEASIRLQNVLNYALFDIPHIRVGTLHEIQSGAVVFAAAIGHSGINLPLYGMMESMRLSQNLLEGCIAGAIIDGESELYTKSVARELLLSANGCGCTLPGKPLVEATGSLLNFQVLSKTKKISKELAYREAARELIARVCTFQKPAQPRPRILTLHASNRGTSNTFTLWGMVREHLAVDMDIHEIMLRNGAVADCEGCAYTTCLHLGERGNCFYGGVMVEEVFPALLACDALMLLCPNYNDAVDANMTAFINRLTALFRSNSFYEKALFALIVSGYSGGDIIARQLLSSLNINKTFQLPPRFCMLETANDPGSIREIAGIEQKALAFAKAMASYLMDALP